jgi:hypothetical protein
MEQSSGLGQLALTDLLGRLRNRITSRELEYPERITSLDDIAERFAMASAKCSPCGEHNTSFSTCTKINPQTDPTNVGIVPSEAIREDLDALASLDLP